MACTLALLAGGCDPEWASWPAEIQLGHTEIRREPGTGRWVFLVPLLNTGKYIEFGPFAAGEMRNVEHLQVDDGSSRYVLETSESSEDGESSCIVRFIDPEPPRGKILEYRVAGYCSEFRLDERLHRKAIFTTLQEGRRLLLIDYQTGEKLGELPFAAPPEQYIHHVQLLGERWVVIVDTPPDTCRAVILDPTGAVLATLTLPGAFKDAIDNGSGLKAIATSRGEVTFDDLIDVTLLKKAEPGVGLVPGAPLAGAPTDLQYHRVQGLDRFVQTSVVWSGSPVTTSVRLFDRSGRRVADLAFRGSNEATVDLNPYKMFILDHSIDPTHPKTDVFIVDLRTGGLVGQPSPTVLDGRYRDATPNEARTGAAVTVTGPGGESTTTVSVP